MCCWCECLTAVKCRVMTKNATKDKNSLTLNSQFFGKDMNIHTHTHTHTGTEFKSLSLNPCQCFHSIDRMMTVNKIRELTEGAGVTKTRSQEANKEIKPIC